MIAATVNWINLMTYDFHGGWDNRTDHHAPLFALSGDLFNVDSAVAIYLATGVPAEKIVVGVPFYGPTPEAIKIVDPALHEATQGKGETA